MNENKLSFDVHIFIPPPNSEKYTPPDKRKMVLIHNIMNYS